MEATEVKPLSDHDVEVLRTAIEQARACGCYRLAAKWEQLLRERVRDANEIGS